MGKVLRTAYAVYPSVKLYQYKTNPTTKKKEMTFKKELLFGDYIKPCIENHAYKTLTVTKEVTEGKGKNKKVKLVQEEYVRIHCRGVDGYIKEEQMQCERPLEVNFVDVGQGDGCHIATPDDQHFIIDAGVHENMFRYLKWRFNLRTAKAAPPAFTVVISHPDSDHYMGFNSIFSHSVTTEEKKEAKKAAKKSGKKEEELAQQFEINRIYHNGMVEESKDGIAGLGTKIEYNKRNYITDLCVTQEDYKKRVETAVAGNYIKALQKSNAEKQMVWKGSDPIYTYNKDGLEMKMEIMAPVGEVIDGKPALPVIGSDKGKTKNGHSVVIKLTIGHLRLLLGGDLNTESEYLLIKHYSGKDMEAIKKQLEEGELTDSERQTLEAELEEAIRKAREALEVDIAKSCHHGSADFSSEFLRTLNPIVTVISSGDEEQYAHPRPDTLGTIGKHSRGVRPMIFSTELARSGKEFLELKNLSAQKKKERVVTVYGMINVRTDGNRAIIAQKLEQPAKGRGWDIHKLEWNDEKGEFDAILDLE